ncbi:hypothetical protein IAU60_001789 [Kwoniella sp. DSM 27419]
MSGNRIPTAIPRISAFPAPTPLGGSSLSSSTRSLRASTSTLGKRGAGDAGLDDHKQMSALKARVSALEHNNHSLQVKDKALNDKIEEQRVEIERLKAERRMLHDGERKERQTGEERERDFYDERKRYSDEITKLRQKNSAISNDYELLKSNHNSLLGRHAQLEADSKVQISLLSSHVQELETQKEDMKGWERRAKGLSIELEEERRRNEERRERGELRKEDKRVDETLQKEMKRQSLSLATIYRENESLKTEVTDLRQKRKEVDSVERAFRDVERSLKDEIRVLQEQLERARRDMDSLTQTFPSDASADSDELRARFTTLNQLYADATSELASRDSAYRDLQKRLATLAESSRSSIAQLTSRAEEAERELRWAKEGRASAERREELARQEAERVRSAGQDFRMPGGVIGDQSSKVAELESLVELYRNELEAMSRDSREVEDRIAKGQGLVKSSELETAWATIEQLQQDMAALEATISELTSANTRLDGEVNDLMRRVASGEYNPATERCIELRTNPAAKIMTVRKQALDDLLEENQQLIARLKELETQPGAGTGLEGMVPRSSYDRLEKEKAELQEAHAKRLLRLKEIFTNKSKEFLEAVYSLLGWRIKFDENGADIRLTSMYAPKGKSGLTLKFASQEGHFGTMQMSGMMARGLEESRHFWIVERQSVPGFLAQVTTEMFEKTTIGRAAGYVGLE